MDEQWRPNKAKLVVVTDAGRVVAFVDPGWPTAWRDEPYYSRLKQWAQDAVSSRGQVLVAIGKRTCAILPDRDIDLGVLAEDERILYVQEGGIHPRLDATVVKKDDPRLAGKVEETPAAFPLRVE
jgi:hypothetical protein